MKRRKLIITTNMCHKYTLKRFINVFQIPESNILSTLETTIITRLSREQPLERDLGFHVRKLYELHRFPRWKAILNFPSIDI